MSAATETKPAFQPTPPVEAPPVGRFLEWFERIWWFTPPMAKLLDATPATGPDPYGDPDPEWLRIDWREHLNWIDVPPSTQPGGAPARVNYVDMGPTEEEQGPPIVFVHGLAGCWQNFLENIPHFARHHRVLAPDLPGFGASPMPPWEIDVEAHGQLIHDLCETLGVQGAVLVGNSMGGFVAAQAVIQEQSRFSKLALISAAGISHARAIRGPAVTGARMSMVLTPYLAGMQERALLRPKLRFQTMRQVFYNPNELRYELLYEFIHNGPGTDGFLPAIRGMLGHDFLEDLERVEMPAFIVWGRHDRVVPPADSAGYGQRLHNSRTVIYDRTGHCAMAERPVRFNRELEEFIAEPAA